MMNAGSARHWKAKMNARVDKPEYEPLLEVATPDIYRTNLFRVLGLSVRATPSDVRRQQQRLAMQKKLGITPSDVSDGPLTLTPPPTDEEVRTAMERLYDPETRLLHEVFWFWPTNGDGVADPGLKALEQGEIGQAIGQWRQEQQTDGNGCGHIAAHNLAVIRHLIAVDYETRLASQGLSGKEQDLLPQVWSQAFSDWKVVLEGEGFWDSLKERVRQLADQKLTTGIVRRMRQTMPKAVLLVNARFAHMAAERAEADLAQRHMRLIREADYGDDVAAAAIREALHPLRQRVKAAVETAKHRWTGTPQHGSRHVRDLHGQVDPLLGILDAMLPSDDLLRSGLHDLVADAMLDGQVAFGMKTNDWHGSIELLKLAQALAVGQSIRTKLDDNVEILKKNAESGNDWCSPGYWDLPQETIDTLEAARSEMQGSNHEGAIRALVVLDPGLGKPLHRCLAFALSQRATQIANEGFLDFNTPTSKLQKFLDVINRKGTVSVPNPYMDSWQLPSCPCCGRSSYTSWANGEFNGQQFWMCSSCSEADNRERERKKGTLRTKIVQALEYLLLAAEIDPGDAGIRDEVKGLKGIAKEVSAKIPKTKALRDRLGGATTRGVPKTFDQITKDAVCYFCGQGPPERDVAIAVPMCGDFTRVELLFGPGIEYHFADVLVPRCRSCRDEHRELPARVKRWEESRREAATEVRFILEYPDIRLACPQCDQHLVAGAEMSGTQVECPSCSASLTVPPKTEATVDFAEGSNITFVCQQCGHDVMADAERSGTQIACSSCSASLTVPTRRDIRADLGAAEKAVSEAMTHAGRALTEQQKAKTALKEAEAIGTKCDHCSSEKLTDYLCRQCDKELFKLGGWWRALIGAIAVAGTPILGVFSFLAAALVYLGLKTRQWQRRSRVRAERAETVPQRRQAEEAKAQEAATQARNDVAAAKEALREREQTRDEAAPRLHAAEEEAIALFESQNPKPAIIAGTKNEDAYADFGLIVELRSRGWGFGAKPKDGETATSTTPKDVRGLVTSRPESAQPPDAPSSSEPKKGRDRIKEIAKQAGGTRIKCPVCGTELKGTSLVRHYDRLHKEEPVPPAVPTSAKTPRNKQSRSGRSGSEKPLRDGCAHDYFTGAPCLCSKCFGTRHEWQDGKCRRCGKRTS